jgi:hypothetical protein
MNVLFEDVSVDVRQEGIFKPAVQNESINEINNCKG